MQQFDLHIRHIAGSHNNLADWLSRSVPDEDEFGDGEATAVPALEAPGTHHAPIPVWHAREGLVPYVPTFRDLEAGYTNMPEDEIPQTYKGNDGLRYSIRTNRLYVPPSCREPFMYWFHGSRFGGHCGVNKTTRRINRWVWWPRIAQDVQSYVKQCLPCIRQAAPPKKSSLRGVLTRPLPLQLVSLDIVGPCQWSANHWYYLVILDHATRYMVARATQEAPTTEWIKTIMDEAWIPIFQAPTAVLTDRGPQFTSAAFREYVTGELQATLIHTSPYYPQGNAANEAAHKAIDASIGAAEQMTSLRPFPRELADAIAVHNSMPHVATGHTPNYLLFGMELTLPGWQRYRREASEAKLREASVREERLKAIARHQLQEEDTLRLLPTEVKVGSWVVFWLSEYERRTQDLETPGAHKYSPKWSLPAKVKEVRDKVCTVEPWGTPDKERQVPLAQVRLLEGAVPASLQRINMGMLDRTPPRIARSAAVINIDGAEDATWDELLKPPKKVTKSGPGPDGRQAGLKRARPAE